VACNSPNDWAINTKWTGGSTIQRSLPDSICVTFFGNGGGWDCETPDAVACGLWENAHGRDCALPRTGAVGAYEPANSYLLQAWRNKASNEAATVDLAVDNKICTADGE